MFYCLVKSRIQPGYLIEEIFKQSVEGVVWFLFATYSKVQKERNKLREELLNIKKPALDHLECSSIIQIAKIRKLIVEKTHSRESTKSVAGQHFAEVLGM